MTLDEFLDKLAAVTKEKSLKWSIDGAKRIRCGCTCPVVAAAGMIGDAVTPTIRNRLGIGHLLSNSIMDAADNFGDLAVRSRLLVACGITQPDGETP